jgi:hypothetical protein
MSVKIDRRTEIERLARKMCKVATNIDPDQLYVVGKPFRVREGFVVSLDSLRPLWTTFLAEAIIAYEEIEQFRAQELAPESVPPSESFDFPDTPSGEDVEAARSWREKQGLA